MADGDPWVPKTRDDWVGIMADGVTKSRKDYEEENAKANANGNGNGGEGNGNGNPPPAKRRSVADIILGVKSD